MARVGVASVLVLLLLAQAALAEETCIVGDDVCSIDESAVKSGLNEPVAVESNVTCIVYFYGLGCPKCAEIEPYMEWLDSKYCGRVKMHFIEISHNETNYLLYEGYADRNGIPLDKRAIPLVAIGDKYYMGVSQIRENLESEILREDPSKGVCPVTGEPGCFLEYNPMDLSPSRRTEVSIPLIVVSGLVDSINPCAFAVMIFLLTFLLQVSSDMKRVVKAGLAYIASVYVTYFLSGIGFLSVVQLMGATGIVVKASAVVAILAGLVNIKDYFWYGRGFTLKIPDSKKETIERWVHKANVPGAMVLGVLVALFELPCTGGVYLAILALMADTLTKAKAVMYLLLYNFMFVAPLVVILALVLGGMKADHIESWRQSKKNFMKLAMGILLVSLGAAMLLS